MRIRHVQLQIVETACGCEGCARRGRELVYLGVDAGVCVVVAPEPVHSLVISLKFCWLGIYQDVGVGEEKRDGTKERGRGATYT